MDKRPKPHGTAQRRRPLAVPLMLAGAVLLSGCSSVPDWANPVTWYDSVFTTDQAPPKATKTAQEAAAKAEDRDKGFPSLRNVPEKAPETSDARERAKVASGLVADRKHARYTDEKLRGGQPLPPPPVLKAEAEATRKAPKPAAEAKPAAKPEPKVALAPRPKTAKVKPPGVKVARATVPPAPPPSALPPAAPVQSAAPQAVATSPRLVPRSQVKRARPAAPYPTLRGSPGGAPAPRSAAAAPASAPAPMIAAAPAPALVPAPAAASAAAPAPSLTLTPPAPTPAAPPPPSAATMAALSGVQAPGQSILLQAFASGLAASAATVTTAPPAAGFAAPAARPLATTDTTAPDVVRKAYNASLSGSPPADTAASGTSRFPRFSRSVETSGSGGFGRGFRPTQSAAFGPTAIKPLAVISFATGSAHLTTTSKAKLRQIVAAYRERGGNVRVVGHASHRTRDLPLHKHKMVNFRISIDRANAVARELVRMGVQTAALRIEAVSDSRPIYFEVMPAGEAKNRRAEVFLEF
ncbi:MAG: OmpA family protein [Alphaproteobacteria bacterium]|nr:OmpA family protein [Alphaproteobacteria bacterium]